MRLTACHNSFATCMPTGLRAIDLICQMLGPMFSGLLMTYAGMWVAMAVIGCYCLAMWLPEVLLLKAIHARSALLRCAQHLGGHLTLVRVQHQTSYCCNARAFSYHRASAGGCCRRTACREARCVPKCGLIAATACNCIRAPKTVQQSSGRRRWLLKALVAGWHTYFVQSTVLAAVALAFLYLTVLSLGLLMTGYVKHLGMSEAALSVFRCVGATSPVQQAHACVLVQLLLQQQ